MDYTIARRRMVSRHIIARGVDDEAVIRVMSQIPRHLFVAEALQSQAYTDYALPIGDKQTISQPYIVAVMTAALRLQPNDRVLEIGTGSGYQAAVLAQLAGQVYSVERIANLARRARRILDSINCSNVHIRVDDGSLGWRDQAPFDAIIVTAGAPGVPDDYLEQLDVGGRLVIPVGSGDSQVLKLIECRAAGEYSETDLLACRFVPLIGARGWRTGAG